jgi:hypothetical protein
MCPRNWVFSSTGSTCPPPAHPTRDRGHLQTDRRRGAAAEDPADLFARAKAQKLLSRQTASRVAQKELDRQVDVMTRRPPNQEVRRGPLCLVVVVAGLSRFAHNNPKPLPTWLP